MTSTRNTGRPGIVAAPGPVRFEPLSPKFIADPYPVYRTLLAHGPIYFGPLGVWVLTRYAHVQTVLRDPRFGRRGFDSVIMQALGPGPVQHSFSRWMLFMDPPDHTRLRTLAGKAFTPRVVEGLRAHVQQIVDGLLDPFERAPGMDLIADLAHPLPVMVICEMLGVPEEDRGGFHEWSADLARALDAISVPTAEIVERGNEAARGLTEYFRRLIAIRRADLRQDLLSALIAAEEQGDRLTEDELLATCVLLFFAGHETTVNLIGNGLLALLRHPDQLAKLRDDPRLIPGAIEELLRYESPAQRTARVTKAEVEIGGKIIPAGQRVVAVLGAANRDPEQFEDPDRLDVTRTDVRHVAFGGGIHYCLGAALARVEAQIAIGSLLRRMPALELATDNPEWRQTSILRGLKALPVRL